jgi:hypothetical protein
VTETAINLSGVSPASLAEQLDNYGLLRLRDVVSADWLEDMRAAVTARVAVHGDGDLLIAQPGDEVGSPAHRLVCDPAVQQLFRDAAELRWPKVSRTIQNIKTVIPVRAGMGAKARTNLFHYDASVLTMIVPIFIPQAAVGSCGELVTIPNKRPFRRFVAAHLVDMALPYSSAYRRRVTRRVLADPEKYVTDLQPGDACLFWGYRTYHGVLDCAPGLQRAVLVLQYGDVHADSFALKVIWRFSGTRRALQRFQYRSGDPLAATRDTVDVAPV